MAEKSHIDESSVTLENAGACGICGSTSFEYLLNSRGIRQGCGREYTIVRCPSCGLAFLNPRPDKESILRYYLEDDAEKTPRKPGLHEKFYFNFFRKVPVKTKGRLLDVGCGSGRYIYLLREKGWDVAGLDIAYTDYGRKALGLNIYEGSIRDANYPSGSFDAVTFWWTLEHMYDPAGMLEEAFRVLKRGGVAVVGVPNIASIEAKAFGKHWFHLFTPKHLYHFSPVSLKAILEGAGFSKVKIRHDMFSFGIIGSIQCYLNAKGIDISFNNPLAYALSLPLDMMLGLAGNSGLITAYAYKE